MAFLTAKQLKDREVPEFPIDIGNGDQVMARRPDLQTLVFEKFMPMPLLNSVMTLIGEWIGKDMQDVTEDAIELSEDMRQFVDRWVCAALIMPRCVLTEDERTDDAIVITDLTLKTKTIIFKESFSYSAVRQSEVAAAETFHQVGPSEGAGQSSEAVQPETIVAA